jgi:hypothetical protein
LLGDVSDERFADLVELGKRMTDFTTEPLAGGDAAPGDMLDDDIGVAVEFEGEDEADDDDDGVDEIAVRLSAAHHPPHLSPSARGPCCRCSIGSHLCSMEASWRLCFAAWTKAASCAYCIRPAEAMMEVCKESEAKGVT